MLFTSIEHPAIACSDVKKQIDWYCKNFGMKVIGSNQQDPPSVVIGYDDDVKTGAMIELMPARDHGADPASFARFQPGIRHVCLRVSDFDAAYEELKKLGVRFTMAEPAV